MKFQQNIVRGITYIHTVVRKMFKKMKKIKRFKCLKVYETGYIKYINKPGDYNFAKAVSKN